MLHIADHVGELWLDGDGVDAFIVEELIDTDGDGGVVGRTATTDVYRSDDSCRRQLPDVELMDVLDSLHLHVHRTRDA